MTGIWFPAEEAVRGPVKAILERAAVDSGIARLGRKLRTGRSVILAYHNVVPEGTRRTESANPGLHLPLPEFERQVEFVREHFRVVGLEELVEARGEDTGDVRAAFTFDDGYRGVVELALPFLVKRDLPSTIFVSPGLAQDNGPFWWDRWLLEGQAVDGSNLRDHAVTALQGERERVSRWGTEHGLEALSPPPCMLPASPPEIREASRLPQQRVGSHTWSHRNLTALSEQTLKQELQQPLQWLQRNVSSWTPWLAYPYGKTTPTVADEAQSSGYSGAVRTDGGWLKSERGQFNLPRLSISAGLSFDGFRMRLGGWLCE